MFEFLKKSENVIHVNDMDKLIGTVDIIDIREPYEYKTGSLKTAKNIPMDTLLKKPDNFLNKDKTYYIMCQSGGRSNSACNILTRNGFQVVNVGGGIGSYVGTNRS